MFFIWEEAGISLLFPHSNEKKQIEVSVAIVTNIDEHSILPNKCRLMPAATATYKITASDVLPVPVKIRMQHCAVIEEDSSLIMMVAHEGPPYYFQKDADGVFSVEPHWCEIERKRLSFFRFLFNSRQVRLSIQVYYHKDLTATFVVTKNLRAHINAVKENIKHTKMEDIPILCESTTDEIILSLPASENGWQITSISEPAKLTRLDINAHEPRSTFPKIILIMKWKGSGNPQEDRVRIPISGVSIKSFSLLCKPKPQMEPFQNLPQQDPPVSSQKPACSDVPSHFSCQPTLPLLIKFPTKSMSFINISENIGTHNHDLGICLLNDETGAVTKNIVACYGPDPNRITKAIFERWLQGTGRKPPCWGTLVSVLRDIKLHTLAQEITDTDKLPERNGELGGTHQQMVRHQLRQNVKFCQGLYTLIMC